MSDISETKTRTPKAKSSLETELHAAKRVGDMLKALSTEGRGRVIELVIRHNNEMYNRELAEKQSLHALRAAPSPSGVILPGEAAESF